MEYQLINNEEAKQYEFHVDGAIAKIEYIRAKDKIYLTHTEIPIGLEGKGIGTALVKKTLDDIREKDLTLIPLCPFVALFIKRNPAYKELVLKGINIA
ncbi:GNAT family N-acetyltransferase [Flagellimonas meishanensis]|uniref:GNAT family N-acetyltransferase n=1 Tax=Flagellimonas meishanensis TaxID=2873264 RepID=UPI001CA76E6F|nr:GNAT family N-acetyltransferase [[Muricauda] meishanensis]